MKKIISLLLLVAQSSLFSASGAFKPPVQPQASAKQMQVLHSKLAAAFSAVDLRELEERSFAMRDHANGKWWIISNINLKPDSIDLRTLEDVIHNHDKALQTCKFDPRFPNYRGLISAKNAEIWQAVYPDIEPPKFGTIEAAPKKKLRFAALKMWFKKQSRRKCGYLEINSHED